MARTAPSARRARSGLRDNRVRSARRDRRAFPVSKVRKEFRAHLPAEATPVQPDLRGIRARRAPRVHKAYRGSRATRVRPATRARQEPPAHRANPESPDPRVRPVPAASPGPPALRASKEFKAALAIEPDHPTALLGGSNIMRDLGHLDQALATYDRGIAKHPSHGGLLANRGVALARKKQIDTCG